MYWRKHTTWIILVLLFLFYRWAQWCCERWSDLLRFRLFGPSSLFPFPMLYLLYYSSLSNSTAWVNIQYHIKMRTLFSPQSLSCPTFQNLGIRQSVKKEADHLAQTDSFMRSYVRWVSNMRAHLVKTSYIKQTSKVIFNKWHFNAAYRIFILFNSSPYTYDVKCMLLAGIKEFLWVTQSWLTIFWWFMCLYSLFPL